MKDKLFPYAVGVVAAAFIGPIAIQMPMIGPLALIPFMYLITLYDQIVPGEFMHTSEHVEIGFAWIELNTSEAFLFYSSFFFLVAMVVFFLKLITLHIPRLNNQNVFLILVVVILFILPTTIPLGIYAYKDYTLTKELSTPTVNRFVCSKYHLLETQPDGTVLLFGKDMTNYKLSSRSIGKINFNTKTVDIPYREGQREGFETAYQRSAKTCTNINGKTLSELYTMTTSRI